MSNLPNELTAQQRYVLALWINTIYKESLNYCKSNPTDIYLPKPFGTKEE